MKTWGWAAAIAVFSVGALGAFWLEDAGLINARAPVFTIPKVALSQANRDADAAPRAPSATAKPGSPSAADQALRTELAAEFRRVADVYEQSSRFPPYSFPVSAEGLLQFQYNRYVPVNVPLQQPGGAGEAEIRLVLEKLHFEKGEPILGLAGVYGPDAGAVNLTEVELLNRSNEVLTRSGIEGGGAGEYPIRLATTVTESADWAADLLVRVKGTWDRREVAAVAPVFLNDPIGRIDGIGNAYVEGAHLQIPVEADVEGPGFYVISGNLYSRDGEPLVHIEHQAELTRFDNGTELQVHHSALRATDNPGPYELRDLTLRQLPSKPGDRVRFGPTSDLKADIPAFDFDRYNGAAYEDPLRQARLNFLRSAGQMQ